MAGVIFVLTSKNVSWNIKTFIKLEDEPLQSFTSSYKKFKVSVISKYIRYHAINDTIDIIFHIDLLLS